ncbi:hypothetical protein HELRODRAFT_173921 [Helobdella robusta]|uniref:Uncharacterized protein n=1 Tax=Helobdella robusta TaxID=6412 RepID=T1F7D9_HELRO|nr:hypothetical protein HELRODRAFT_173921 [Helobdella robusta]ESO03051.1 hypothetical protein HELRODRAFT_173921 [Helobdella robusta]
MVNSIKSRGKVKSKKKKAINRFKSKNNLHVRHALFAGDTNIDIQQWHLDMWIKNLEQASDQYTTIAILLEVQKLSRIDIDSITVNDEVIPFCQTAANLGFIIDSAPSHKLFLALSPSKLASVKIVQIKPSLHGSLFKI